MALGTVCLIELLWSPPIEVLLLPQGVTVLFSGGAPTALWNVSGIGLVTLDRDYLFVETHTWGMCLIHTEPLAPRLVVAENTPQTAVK